MSKNDNNIFCKRLKTLRKAAGMSQTELGKKLKLSRTAISYYERGERNPNTEIIKTISEHFNCSIDYLMGLSETPNSNEIIKAAIELMGLSEKDAVLLINRWVLKENNQMDIFNFMIEMEYEGRHISDNIDDFENFPGDDLEKYAQVRFLFNPKYQPILSTIIDYIAFDDENVHDKDSVTRDDISFFLNLQKMAIEFRRYCKEHKQPTINHTEGGK